MVVILLLGVFFFNCCFYCCICYDDNIDKYISCKTCDNLVCNECTIKLIDEIEINPTKILFEYCISNDNKTDDNMTKHILKDLMCPICKSQMLDVLIK